MNCNGRILDLSQACVMGILNVTPDSFSDGGKFCSPAAALLRARQMIDQGAAIIDVGGESTRPGACPVSLEQELERVIPVIELLAMEAPVVISIDTSKPQVMQAAVAAGAGMINDIWALRAPGALEMAVQLNLHSSIPVCLMHMQGDPATMQNAPRYENLIDEVRNFLRQRINVCTAAGIARNRLLIDPGFGFGKSLAHNLRLLRHMQRFMELNLPVVAGLSRKGMLGVLLNAPPERRLYGSLALATLAVWQGAAIIRAHDVQASLEAIKVCNAVKNPS